MLFHSREPNNLISVIIKGKVLNENREINET
jgi:hypothetical protein